MGKSSLVLQFVKKEFADYRESTIGTFYCFLLLLAVVSPFTWCGNWAHECVAWLNLGRRDGDGDAVVRAFEPLLSGRQVV